MDDQQLREIIKYSFSFLMNYTHPRVQMVGDLARYLKDVRVVNGNGNLEELAGKIVFKFTYGGYLVEDKIQKDPIDGRKYRVVSYKLKNGFDFDDVVERFFETLKEKEGVKV